MERWISTESARSKNDLVVGVLVQGARHMNGIVHRLDGRVPGMWRRENVAYLKGPFLVWSGSNSGYSFSSSTRLCSTRVLHCGAPLWSGASGGPRHLYVQQSFETFSGYPAQIKRQHLPKPSYLYCGAKDWTKHSSFDFHFITQALAHAMGVLPGRYLLWFSELMVQSYY